jgi:pyrimidine deaminase RibD-like protein
MTPDPIEFSASDYAMMARALRLAERGAFTTKPNPMVGCVLAKDGVVVGEGWHHRAGGPHAEVFALEAAGETARGATAYVTLEPCSHVGRTGPCADALIAAGVVRVVAAMRDPNPLVHGAGFERLHDDVFIIVGRQENDGDVGPAGVGLDLTAGAEPVNLRHHDIQQNEVRRLHGQLLEGLLRTAREGDAVGHHGEHVADSPEIFLLVVNNEDRFLLRCGHAAYAFVDDAVRVIVQIKSCGCNE